MQKTFSAAIEDAPLRSFQLLVVAFGLMMLVIEGIDLQSLSLVTPLIIDEWGIDRALFGPALAGAMFGMAFGSIFGGLLGDRFGRLTLLFLAACIFGATTILAAYTHDVWSITAVRVLGGIGFGAAYPNAIALVGDWVPERLRTYVVSIMAVGVPVGTAASAAIVPLLLPDHGWRGTFVIFGFGSIVLGLLTLVTIREAPGYLLAKGRREAAQRSAAKVIDASIELLPEPAPAEQGIGAAIGVLHPLNKRLNWGVSISFTACTAIVYGLSSWTPEFLTSSGFTLGQALQASFYFGVASVIGGISAGYFARAFGSRAVANTCAVLLFVCFIAIHFMLESITALPSETQRQIVTGMIGLAGALVSVAMATLYAVMVVGYPQSCRSGGIGFVLTMGRFGGIALVFSGGLLLNLGGESFVYYFAVLAVTSLAVAASSVINDRQIEPAARAIHPT